MGSLLLESSVRGALLIAAVALVLWALRIKTASVRHAAACTDEQDEHCAASARHDGEHDAQYWRAHLRVEDLGAAGGVLARRLREPNASLSKPSSLAIQRQ